MDGRSMRLKPFILFAGLFLFFSLLTASVSTEIVIEKETSNKETLDIGRGATFIYHNITMDTTWVKEGSPYTIRDTVHIINGSTLFIQPGVRVVFEENGVLVGGLWQSPSGDWATTKSTGNIQAIGTKEKKITFSSNRNHNDDDQITIGASLKDKFVFEYCEFHSIGRITLFGSDCCLFRNCNISGDTVITIDKGQSFAGDASPSNNTISYCNFVDNNISINIESAVNGSFPPNRFYSNNFINSTYPVVINTSLIDYGDLWNDSAQQGNYWSDYNGTDLDSDGVGDTNLPWHGVEYFPLMEPVPYVDDNGTPEKDSDGDGYNDTFENASGSDPHNPRSTPPDRDGDGIPNELDAYPDDPTRWRRERIDIISLRLIMIIAGLVLLVVVLFSYTTLNRKRILANEKRQAILNYIDANPGEHYRSILRNLGMSRGTLSHHLDKLEKEEMIRCRTKGMFKYFYLVSQIDVTKKRILTPTQKQIAGLITQNPGVTYKEMAEDLGMTTAGVAYHVKALDIMDVVKSEKMNKNLYWFPGDSAQ